MADEIGITQQAMSKRIARLNLRMLKPRGPERKHNLVVFPESEPEIVLPAPSPIQGPVRRVMAIIC